MNEHAATNGPKTKLTHDEVAKKAYAIYEKEGHPQGHAEQNWSEAEGKTPHTGSDHPDHHDHHAHMAADYRKSVPREANHERTERPASMGKAKILIVDDHPIVRTGLRYLIELEGDLEVCGEAGSAHDALVGFDVLCPDLVLLDLSLPDGNGWDVIRHLRQHWFGAKILVVSVWDQFNAAALIEAGAMGFVNKHDANERLIQAIRTVLNDQVYRVDEAIATRGNRGASK